MNKVEKNKLMEVIERLTRIEEKVGIIQEHTKTMNEELGECRDAINSIKKHPLISLTWKKFLAIVGGISTLATAAYYVLKVLGIIKI